MSAIESLFDVNLQGLPSESLHVRWQVRVAHRGRAPHYPWLEARTLEFTPTHWHLETTTNEHHQGSWSIERVAGLERPYVVLHHANEPQQALITRFRNTPSGQQRRLMLYFQSGLELELTHP